PRPPHIIQAEGAGPLRTSPAVIASASEIYSLASPAPAARTAAPRRPAARTTTSTDSPRPAGPQPRDGLRLARPHPQTRLGRRGPSPATACGSHDHIHRLASAGGAPAPRRPAARTTPSTDSPRPAGPQPRDGLRLARPHPQTRLAARVAEPPRPPLGSHCHSPEFLPLDGLAVEALGDEDVADAMDHRLAPADVGDEPGDVGDQTRDRLGEAARSVPRSARHRRLVREAGAPPPERAERRGVFETRRVARPG